MKQNNIIKRVIERYPYLSLRKVGFPYVGKRLDDKDYSKYVKDVADGFDFYDELLSKYYDKNRRRFSNLILFENKIKIFNGKINFLAK